MDHVPCWSSDSRASHKQGKYVLAFPPSRDVLLPAGVSAWASHCGSAAPRPTSSRLGWIELFTVHGIDNLSRSDSRTCQLSIVKSSSDSQYTSTSLSSWNPVALVSWQYRLFSFAKIPFWNTGQLYNYKYITRQVWAHWTRVPDTLSRSW